MYSVTTKIGRNENCPCGTKRPNGLPMKFKNCCMNKKPRTTEILMAFSERPDKIGEKPDGTLEFLDDQGNLMKPSYAHSETWYVKEDGDKKTVTFASDAYHDYFEHLRSYDFIFAIDTNTEEINGVNIASTCVYELLIEARNEEGDPVVFAGPSLLRFKNGEGGMDEKLAIILLISQIRQSKNVKEDAKIAIITDHDLGNHGAYNKQEKPIWKNHILPKGFALLYASGDTTNKNNNILTFAVSKCDKAAKEDLTFFREAKFFRAGGFAIPVEQMIDVDNHSGRIGVPVFKK